MLTSFVFPIGLLALGGRGVDYSALSLQHLVQGYPGDIAGLVPDQ